MAFEKTKSWFGRHPVIAGLFAVASFLIWAVPQWLNSVWGLFQSEPFGQWLVKQKFPSSIAFSPSWITGPISGVLLATILWLLISGRRAAKAKSNELTQPISQPVRQPRRNPKVELQSEGGFIAARITNDSDSEVRVEYLWIVVVDATGKETLHKDRIRKFKRCTKMPHVMPPHSSFETIFSFSEGGFRSHALNPLAIAVKEYWIEVKLEDGTIIPSEHREIATPTNGLANSEVDTSPKAIIELLDDLIIEGTAIEKSCGDMCDGEIAKSKVEAWIATVRSTLRSSAPDYVAAFNDAVTNGGGERLYPPDRGSRTVIEMGDWAKDRVRQESWQLVFACLVKLKEIRRAMRGKLPL